MQLSILKLESSDINTALVTMGLKAFLRRLLSCHCSEDGYYRAEAIRQINYADNPDLSSSSTSLRASLPQRSSLPTGRRDSVMSAASPPRSSSIKESHSITDKKECNSITATQQERNSITAPKKKSRFELPSDF